MKTLKIIILFMFVITLCGCTTTYELKIDGNQFKEKITTYIYMGDRESAKYDDEATASRIDAFVERDVYPYFQRYDSVYDKKVNKINDYEEVILKYKYNGDEYKDSNAVNLCFENRNFDITEDYYDINLSGYFYCLYDNKTFDIKIQTSNKVIKHNADAKEGNKYVWHIDSSNFKDVNIQMKIGKESFVNI